MNSNISIIYNSSSRKPFQAIHQKKASLAFILFSIDIKRKSIINGLQGLTAKERSVRLNELWSELSEEDKEIYNEKVRRGKAKFIRKSQNLSQYQRGGAKDEDGTVLMETQAINLEPRGKKLKCENSIGIVIHPKIAYREVAEFDINQQFLPVKADISSMDYMSNLTNSLCLNKVPSLQAIMGKSNSLMSTVNRDSSRSNSLPPLVRSGFESLCTKVDNLREKVLQQLQAVPKSDDSSNQVMSGESAEFVARSLFAKIEKLKRNIQLQLQSAPKTSLSQLTSVGLSSPLSHKFDI